ncbi:heme NO-binding domain-containing protein [Acidiphilium sp.]|uniref:heme NO-binding domain-containing protein n=1 Tax=Acidiphilium sp. TaxID=527 RepID=UPI003D017C49
MIGLIPFLVDNFTANELGDDARQDLLATLDLPADFTFSIARNYDDDLCRRVITLMVIRLGLPMTILYDRLGEYFLGWMLEHMGGVFAGAADTATFLTRLPTVYNSFGGSARDAGMHGSSDLVAVRRFGDRLRVTYQSQSRFAAFYASFMKAVAAHFNESVTIAIVAGDIEAPFCVFDVTMNPPVDPLIDDHARTLQPEASLSHGQ